MAFFKKITFLLTALALHVNAAPKTYLEIEDTYRQSVVSFSSPEAPHFILGTAISKNRVLTKWSEIANQVNYHLEDYRKNKFFELTVLGVYPDDDLALIEVEQANFTPLNFELNHPVLTPGSIIINIPSQKLFGKYATISNTPRTTRIADRGFLGIGFNSMNDGSGNIIITTVLPDAPSKKAGLVKNDIITHLNSIKLTGRTHFTHLLQSTPAKETITLSIQRENTASFDKKITLTYFPKIAATSAFWYKAYSLQRINHISTELSSVREEFPWVAQTDLKINANECGSPALNTKGNAVGILVARNSRICSYLIPNKRIQELLNNDPMSVKEAKEYLSERRSELAFPRTK